ncbi:dihydropteroate synthase [Hydrogenobacter thermophilus]|uniref:dihydropteroate synthase n=1 Tax=Hydrogenobacter thermophilus TaxID=940 RepID=UPI0030F898FF
MLIKSFKDRDAFYRFLKEKVGIFFKEADSRAFEGIFHVIYFEDKNTDPSLLFDCARSSCVSLFYQEGRYAICGSEARIRDFCSCIVKKHKSLSFKILEGLINYRKKSFKLQYNYKVLPLGIKTAVMGVLNVTPDSFSDGGLYMDVAQAVKRGVQMAQEGAEIIDIGGESTRPGSERISTDEELRRVLPVLKELRKELPNIWISIDTYKSQVAKACLEEGADMINDISGGSFDQNMFDVIATYSCPYVMGHTKGRPEEWKHMTIIYEDVMQELVEWFEKGVQKLRQKGHKGDIILDPCIGFGKLPEHNVEILKRFRELKVFGLPLLVGVSRKSFIGLIIEGLLRKKTEPRERLYGSLGALAYAVIEGTNIVRTHDVKETKEFLALLDTIRTYGEF